MKEFKYLGSFSRYKPHFVYFSLTFPTAKNIYFLFLGCVPPRRDPVLVLWGVRWGWLCSSAGRRRWRWSRHSWSPPWRGAALSAPHPVGSACQSGTAASTSEPAAAPPVLRDRGTHTVRGAAEGQRRDTQAQKNKTQEVFLQGLIFWQHNPLYAMMLSCQICLSQVSTRTFDLHLTR